VLLCSSLGRNILLMPTAFQGSALPVRFAWLMVTAAPTLVYNIPALREAEEGAADVTDFVFFDC
jgi:hypothetical protein